MRPTHVAIWLTRLSIYAADVATAANATTAAIASYCEHLQLRVGGKDAFLYRIKNVTLRQGYADLSDAAQRRLNQRLPKPEPLQLDCGSGSTAMGVSDSCLSRWNRSHKEDPVF